MSNRTKIHKIKQAIKECDRYISKEGKRSDDLRPKEIKELLDWYISHKEKLILMLDELSNP